ncbi:penicillin-binding transpeptidase domain-containing protein [Kineosporia sp. A_224]|uniref:penicillin-binding transpeptidase domain-containing protein n=1 Tax=Kineosporia sp. A_224 TaxID=1962180 RepID=UPI001179A609|nr:penicillin-binding transpeptidase domain-containing protein [Kineosporia sp. A_224]
MAGSRRTVVVLVTVGAVLAGSAVGAGVALFGGGDSVRTAAAAPSATRSATPTPTPTLVPGADDADPVVAAKAVGTAYLDAWETGDWLTMQGQLDSSGGNLERALGGMNGRLGVTSVSTAPGEPAADGGSLPFSVTLTLEDLGDVTWSTELTISRNEQAARSQVHFTAASVYPTLKTGQRLELVASPDSRGDILDRKGRSLAKQPDLVANVIGRYDAGSGSATGLQRVLADDLGGDEKRSVGVVDVQNKTVAKVVKTFPGSTQVPGVRTTLDVTYQQAATKALAGTRSKAAIVAIDVRTGEVRAVANRPYTGVPPALSGRYAPGSTFKIVTALAALRNGKTPSSTVSCPTTINSYGKIFKNHEKAPNRSMSLTEAFADSCNTAFIGLARSLPEGALASAAEDLGFNADQPLPVASFGGSYPTPKDNAELAASAIGQGRVEASPLQMASVAAAVASGTYRQPRLVADCSDCVTTPIPEAAKIRPMMRAVVTSGTGTAAAGVPGGAVYAKTGTAEFGSGTALKNHAWFVGWQGTTAFAVFVDVGASGGETAAPIAARFLRGLA